MYLAENLSSVRKKWGYNQTEMAEIFNINFNQIGNYERKEATPNVYFFIRLEEVTGISFFRYTNTLLSMREIPYTPLMGEANIDTGILKEPNSEYQKAKEEISDALTPLAEKLKMFETAIELMKKDLAEKELRIKELEGKILKIEGKE